MEYGNKMEMQNEVKAEIKEAKKLIRKEILALRMALTPEEVKEKSEIIISYLKELTPLNQAKAIMGYAPFRNEVDIMPWLYEKRLSGVRVMLPRVIKGTNDMEPVLLTEEAMREGSYGIKEPEGPAQPLSGIEALIVPGVVFDREGYRIGYGAGFYDRFIPRLNPETFICAVAFELQLVDKVPREPNDRRIPYLVTEKGVFEFSKA